MTNRTILMCASFLTLIAAGVGFAVRADVLGQWAQAFGFTQTELGQITGMGLVGFGLVIVAGSFIAEKLGYKTVLVTAFLLHFISGLLLLAATPAFEASGKDSVWWILWTSMLFFSVANGLCEAAINPLIATLYSDEKTHYLNMLHAGWPGGLIIGAVLAYCFVGENAWVISLRWEIPMILFMIPTLIYGILILKEKFPVSEARAAGHTIGDMLKEFASPLLLFLLFLMGCVGYVELGTDSWIVDIMRNVIAKNAVLLFIYTSGIMFVLRFFAGPIVERINPIGLLMVSSVLGFVGLMWLGSAATGLTVLAAATVYGVGKTFLWPTMLGVVGEKFPKGGALTMGSVGAVGALVAGLLGGPGIGYKQDYYATQYLQTEAPEIYETVKAASPNRFLILPAINGIDGRKAGKIAATDERFDIIRTARLFGGRMALRWTAVVPAVMAISFLLLVLYFRSKGGYTVDRIGRVEED